MNISRIPTFCVLVAAMLLPAIPGVAGELPLRRDDFVVTGPTGVAIMDDAVCAAVAPGIETDAKARIIASASDFEAASGLPDEQVFGLALRLNETTGEHDIFVASSIVYGSSRASGHIYRIDGVSGVVEVFATLPNRQGGGIGQLAYNATDDVFYATNFNDGALYTLSVSTDATGALSGRIQGALDPFAGAHTHPDTLAPVSHSATERIFGVGYSEAERRVYWGLWVTDQGRASKGSYNRIYSSPVDSTGVAFRDTFPNAPWRLEMLLPHHGNVPFSSPVSDIVVDAAGERLLAASRSMNGDRNVAPGFGSVLEFRGQGGSWVENPVSLPPAEADGAELSVGRGGSMGAGGVSLDSGVGLCKTGPMVLAASHQLNSIEGVQLLDAKGGNISDSLAARTGFEVADVEACAGCPPREIDYPEICDDGFDNNLDGIADCDAAECERLNVCTGRPFCTRHKGWWKNNHGLTKGGNFEWPVPETTEVCGKGYLWIVNQSTMDPWFIVARHWVSFELNRQAGAYVPPAVEDAAAIAKAYVEECDLEAKGKLELEAKDIIEDFNNGLLGPGLCVDVFGTDRPEEVGLRSGERGEAPAAGCNAASSTSTGGAMTLLLLLSIAMLRPGERNRPMLRSSVDS